MKLYLILLFATFAKINESKIVINISADNEHSTISFAGTEIQKATPRGMRQLFLIDKQTMQGYIGTLYNNTIPRKVLFSSTQTQKTKSRDRQGDVHKRFNWDPVMLVSSVKSAGLKDVMEGASLQFSRSFKNPTNETKKVNAGIQMPVAITLQTMWYTTPYSERYFDSNYDFVFDINVNFNETSITHTTTFGKPSQVHEHVNIGRSIYEIELKPGQAVIAQFSAKVCHLVMKAVIVTSVTGNMAVNFKEPVNDRHWWGPKIEDVLKNVNRSSVSPVKENLIVRLYYYFDAKVEILDKKTRLLLPEFSMQ